MGCFILEIYFQKININLNKTDFKPDWGHFVKSLRKITIMKVSAILVSIKGSNETNFNGTIAGQIIML